MKKKRSALFFLLMLMLILLLLLGVALLIQGIRQGPFVFIGSEHL